jgi:hypothetical protein
MAAFEAKLDLVMANQETLQRENAKLKSQHDATEKANVKLRAELGALKQQQQRSRASATVTTTSTERIPKKRTRHNRTTPQERSLGVDGAGGGDGGDGDGDGDDSGDGDDAEGDAAAPSGDQDDQRPRNHRRLNTNYKHPQSSSNVLAELEKLSSEREIQDLKREKDKYRLLWDVANLISNKH